MDLQHFFNSLIFITLFIIVVKCDDIDGISNLSKHPVLIVISFDGFRFDLFNHAKTPVLDSLRATGTSVPYMRNQFVTKTFPNHMSIVTGLHAENHGVVDNDFYDPKYNQTMKPESDLFWNFDNTTLPLWTINEDAGEGRKSGVMMWPGSDEAYGPHFTTPYRTVPWSEKRPFEYRIDKVVEWITDKENPVNLVFMYFEEPDEFAHAFGPESKEVIEKIEQLDNITGYFVDKLKEKKIFDKVNLIFLSDHGFQQVRAKDMINISSVVDPKLYNQYGSTPVMQIQPKPGNFEQVYQSLKDASITQNFTVYNKEELAKVSGWYYSKNRRIMDIVVVADLGFVFEDFAKKVIYYDTHFNRTPSPENFYGVHGYDNHLMPMHPFFIAHGPLFKRKFQGDPFDNVDLFPLVCKMMRIKVPPNNGTYANVKSLLALTGRGFAVGSPVGWAIGAGLIFGVMILLGILSILASTRGQRRRNVSQEGTSGYRFVNRQNSMDSTDENDNLGGELQPSSHSNPSRYEDGRNDNKEECQALLMASSTEDV